MVSFGEQILMEMALLQVQIFNLDRLHMYVHSTVWNGGIGAEPTYVRWILWMLMALREQKNRANGDIGIRTQ